MKHIEPPPETDTSTIKSSNSASRDIFTSVEIPILDTSTKRSSNQAPFVKISISEDGRGEFLNNRVQKFTNDGVFITKWGSAGTGNGQFIYPRSRC